jgi:hypothetical protein
MKYAMWSMKGEPLEFTTKTGSAWGYKTSYELIDAKGKVIASGKPDFEETIDRPPRSLRACRAGVKRCRTSSERAQRLHA